MIILPPSCLIWISAFSLTTVCPPVLSGEGWLMTGVELTVTDRLPCATATGSSETAWFMTTEPVRALTITLGCTRHGVDVEVLELGHEGDAVVGACGRAHLDHASSRGLRDTIAMRRLIASATRPAVPKIHRMQFKTQQPSPLRKGARHGALDGRAAWNRDPR